MCVFLFRRTSFGGLEHTGLAAATLLLCPQPGSTKTVTIRRFDRLELDYPVVSGPDFLAPRKKYVNKADINS
ncbi:hypothetical protein DBT52_09400 [Aerococcus mictus]|nr:hypothetical protein DBT52_09400 [Aerococcus mictus]